MDDVTAVSRKSGRRTTVSRSKMAASMELRLDNLPSDPLLLILSFMDFRDLFQYVNLISTERISSNYVEIYLVYI